MKEQVARKLGNDAHKYYDLQVTHEKMLDNSFESVDFDICRQLVGIHRANLIFETTETRKKYESNSDYQNVLTSKALEQIKLRRYGSLHFRQHPILRGESYIFFPVPYYLFVLCIRMLELLYSDKAKKDLSCYSLFSSIVNKGLVALSLLEDNFLDNAYPLCRGVIEMYIKLLVMMNKPETITEYETFLRYELDKSCISQTYCDEFNDKYSTRKHQGSKDKIDYLHYGWVDVLSDYHSIVKVKPYSINVLIEYLHKHKIVVDTFASDDFNRALEDFLDRKNMQTLNVQDLVEFLQETLSSKEQTIDFDLSPNQINRITSQIYEKRDFDKNQIEKALSQLNASLKKSKKLREQMTASSIDGYEDFVTQKENFEKAIINLTAKLETKQHELEQQILVLEESQKNLEKSKIAYENVLKNKSISNISERAAATFSLVEERLVLRQAKILQQEFINCFNSIINKNNFIDGIVIDKKINVIPYKYVTVTRNQLDNYKIVNKDFLNLFDNVQFILDMNKLEFCEVKSIRLPSPITAPFSQGERQVYIMSIYLALLKTSHKDIPFFIDTPFARIDSEHRENIVTEFFTKLKNQMFVLSTDEEIVGEYKSMMNKNISNVFTLQISDYGATKIKSNTYFGE